VSAASDRTAAGRSTRLIDRFREELRLRAYSRRTTEAYEHWLRRFLRFHGLRPPREMGAEEVSAFLSHLASGGGVSALTQNQALAALLFLDRCVLGVGLPGLDGVVRAKRPQRHPPVLSVQETAALLSALEGPGAPPRGAPTSRSA
jgi:site-specific recombinase XerD